MYLSDKDISGLRLKLARKVRYHLGAYCPDVEDVVQETLARSLQADQAQKIQHPENPGAFLNGVCNNVIAEYRRRLLREGPDIDDLPERAEPGRTHAEKTELRQAVDHALSQLLERDCRVLTGLLLEERPASEVCEENDISEEHLRVVLFRAKARFRRIYEQGVKPAASTGHLGSDP